MLLRFPRLMPAEVHLLFPAARPAEAIRTGWKLSAVATAL